MKVFKLLSNFLAKSRDTKILKERNVIKKRKPIQEHNTRFVILPLTSRDAIVSIAGTKTPNTS